MMSRASLGDHLAALGSIVRSEELSGRLFVRCSIEVRCETQWGDTVVIVGSTEQFGMWRPDRALRLATEARALRRGQLMREAHVAQRLEKTVSQAIVLSVRIAAPNEVRVRLQRLKQSAHLVFRPLGHVMFGRCEIVVIVSVHGGSIAGDLDILVAMLAQQTLEVSLVV